jgi:hypothetical protein
MGPVERVLSVCNVLTHWKPWVEASDPQSPKEDVMMATACVSWVLR